VFANAGVAKAAPFGTITEEFYESIFNVNVKGLLFTVQKALPLGWCPGDENVEYNSG
jgi:NAD(P)-dependent dehydrogenase (short-subunit alcohol dehydrogenase family)